MANNSQKKKITVNKFTLEVRKEKKNPGSSASTGDCYLAAVAPWKTTSSWNLQCFSTGRKYRPALASSAADSHLPSACICIHFNAHIEREHVFNGNHSKMNYTDSVEDLMIFSPQDAQADDRSWPRQLKMTGSGSRLAVETGSPGTHSFSLARGGWRQPWRQVLGWELGVWPSF